jgi:LuxR family maltose regulon positive regulatory protein
LIVQSLAHQVQGEQPQALASLERALTLAEPEGYVRIFADEGEAMRVLLEPLSRRLSSACCGYAVKLLAALSQTVPASKRDVIPQNPTLPEPLSDRELEVLKLLRSELSGPEIARQLIVSLNTLRSHTKNIFAKLGVSNRRAAVRRAEELGLF